MRAVQVVSLDGPSSVLVREVDPPRRGPDDVLIEVRAAGLNFPDVLQTKGLYQHKPELPFTIGSEVSGVVREAPGGSPLRPGDRVAAFCTVGGAAELVSVPAGNVFPLPDAVSFTAGAALPMNYLTVHFALLVRGRLRAGETVLVHGAAGGVGTAAIQFAAALGARVIGVASTSVKAEVAVAAGASDAVPVEGFRDAVKELTGGRGVDMVVDPVGGERFTDSLRCLAPQGRLLVIGFTAGDIPTVKVNRLLLNNIDVVGVGWGAYALARPGYLAEQWTELTPYFGALDPLVSGTYPLEEAPEALAGIDRREVTGKVVLLTG